MDLQIGRLVTSTAGRDAGRPYVVFKLPADGFVLVVDGDKRPVHRPKRKNPRHLQIHEGVDAQLAARWARGETVNDAEVRVALAALAAELKEAG